MCDLRDMEFFAQNSSCEKCSVSVHPYRTKGLEGKINPKRFEKWRSHIP